jgi:hypothetical protein
MSYFEQFAKVKHVDLNGLVRGGEALAIEAEDHTVNTARVAALGIPSYRTLLHR